MRLLSWLLELVGVYDGDWGGPGKASDGTMRPRKVNLPDDDLRYDAKAWRRVREQEIEK